MSAPSSAPLTGFRVLSLAHLYPGPFATMMLADLGADVIIVEGPQAGDRTRRFEGHFEALNRNKRAVALDLKDAAGKEAFLRLVETADVVLEGFRPGVMAKLGLDPETLRQRKPGLICVSISSYGQDGPMREHGGHDLSLQGAAGLIEVEPGSEAAASLPRLALSDIASANAAALGIVCALLRRERTGQASTVDVSMLDCVVSWMAPYLVPAMNGLTPARLPPHDPGYGIFASSDGVQFTLSISGEDHLWDALVRLLELPDLVGVPEPARVARRAELQSRLREVMSSRTMAWITPEFSKHKIPFGPVNRLMEVLADPQVQSRGLVVELAAAAGQPARRYVRQPLVFDGERTGVWGRAPVLGRDNREIFDPLVGGPPK